jgi:hypothetical protein
MSLKTTAFFLQVLATLLIGMGLSALIAHLVSPRMVAIFGQVIPSYVVALSVISVGAYYWLRASRLKQRVAQGNTL